MTDTPDFHHIDESNDGLPQVSPSQLRDWLDSLDPPLLLDVREPEERRFCRIVVPEGSDLFLPIGQVPEHQEALQIRVGARALVVYCHHGIRSAWATRLLLATGLERVVNLDGGIDAWSRLVDPECPRYS